MALTKILQEGIKDGEIVNADINASAAIATSKISGLATSATTDTTNASNIGSGTLPDGRFPATLPAVSGANLTGIDTDLVSDTSPQLGGDLDTNSHHILLDDDHNLKFGDDTDLEIFHESAGTRNIINSHRLLELFSNGNTSIRTNNNDLMIHCVKNGSTELYYDNAKKLHTVAGGITTTGYVNIEGGSSGQLYIQDNGKVNLGSQNDLQIYHDGSNSWIDNGTGLLRLSTDGAEIELTGTGGSEYLGRFINNGAVELYYDGVKKAHTYSAGFKVDGIQRNVAAGYNYLLVGSNDASGVSIGLDGDSNGDGVGGDYAYLEHGSDGDFSIVCDNPAGDSQFELYVGNGTNTAIIAQAAGETQLYYNGSLKINTGAVYNEIQGASNGNPAGLKVRNTDTNSNHSHAELRLESKNGASYGAIFNDHNNSCVRIGHNTTGSTLEVFNDGTIRAQGIKFGSDTASANDLDDYEEGTFTASMGSSGGGASFNSGATASGLYTKIGGLVYVQVYFGCNIAAAGSGVAVVSGLPFTSNSSSYYPLTITHTTMTVGTVQNGYVQYGGTIFYPIAENGTGGSALSAGNPRYMMIAGCYPVW